MSVLEVCEPFRTSMGGKNNGKTTTYGAQRT
nr:MAG TPA: hypothetical protein [Caudoviricetes sp.]